MDPQEARIYKVILIIALTLGTIITYFIISIIRQQRLTIEIQKSLMLAELSAMEKERARIAADLHDDISPMLSFVKFQVDSIESVSREEKVHLQTASGYVDDMLTKIREISNNLMPSSLIQKGLKVALKECVTSAAVAGEMALQFSYDDNIQLSQEQNVNIYRIVQEVVYNCRKYAAATELVIRLEIKNNWLCIYIKDNGIGFDFKKTMLESTGIGLKSVKNRAEVMGGSMVIESQQGKGTAILFKIPIN